jgi:LysM repeat protein
MNYPQLWRSPCLAFTLLLANFAVPGTIAASHTVRSGDTFTAIARKYQVTVGSLQKANPGVKPGVISKGQVLNLPGPPVAAVKKTITNSAPAKSNPAAEASLARQAASPKGRDLKSKDKAPPAKNSPREETASEAARPSPAPANRPASITTYRVKSGETLTGLARRSGVSVGDLVEMNGLEQTALHEGQKLILPSPSREIQGHERDHTQDQTVDLTPPARRPRTEDPAPRRPAAPAPSPATQGTYYHVVQRGDTYSSIARRFGVSVAALSKANRTVDPTRLTVSQRLNVPGVQVASREGNNGIMDESPPARTTSYRFDDPSANQPESPTGEDGPTDLSREVAYHVTSSDTLESIAREFKTTPKELSQLNKMSPWDRLTPGNYIIVPWQDHARRD